MVINVFQACYFKISFFFTALLKSKPKTKIGYQQSFSLLQVQIFFSDKLFSKYFLKKNLIYGTAAAQFFS